MFYRAQIFTLDSDVVLNTKKSSILHGIAPNQYIIGHQPISEKIYIGSVIKSETQPTVLQLKSK